MIKKTKSLFESTVTNLQYIYILYVLRSRTDAADPSTYLGAWDVTKALNELCNDVYDENSKKTVDAKLRLMADLGISGKFTEETELAAIEKFYATCLPEVFGGKVKSIVGAKRENKYYFEPMAAKVCKEGTGSAAAAAEEKPAFSETVPAAVKEAAPSTGELEEILENASLITSLDMLPTITAYFGMDPETLQVKESGKALKLGMVEAAFTNVSDVQLRRFCIEHMDTVTLRKPKWLRKSLVKDLEKVIERYREI